MNDRFKLLRESLDMTMKDFGEVIGITKSGVSEIESGRRKVTPKHIQTLTLKPVNGKMISADWLRTGKGEMFIEREQSEIMHDALDEIMTAGSADFRRRLISVLLQLPEEKWTVLEEIAEEIAKDAKYAAPARESEPPEETPEEYGIRIGIEAYNQKKPESEVSNSPDSNENMA